MKKAAIFVLSLLLPCICLHGQGVSHTEQRLMRAKVFDLLQEYENISSFYSENDRKSCLRLFGNDGDSRVFMDLLGSPDFRSMVSLDRYLEYIEKNDLHPSFQMRILSIGDIKRTGKNLVMAVSFQKSVSYFDKFDTYYSSSDYLRAETVLTASFQYNPENGSCRFRQIDGKIDSSTPNLPDRYYVIKKNTDHPGLAENDEKLLKINGLRPFNAYDQTFCLQDPSELSTWDDDLSLSWDRKRRDKRYSEISFTYRLLQNRLKPRFAFAPLGAYSVRGADGMDIHSSAMEIGVDFGRQFPLSPSFNLGVFSGVAVSYGHLSLKDGNIKYGFPLTDTGGMDYQREYSISEVSTGLKFSDLLIPLYADLDMKLSTPVHFHVNAGIKAYLNMGTKVTPYHVIADITGPIGSAASTGLPVHLDQDVHSFLQPASYERSSFDISATAGIQLDYSPGFFKNRMLLFVGVGFEQGITRSYHSEELPFSDPTHSFYPLFYDDLSKSDIHFAPMVSGLSYRRQALWLQGGLIFKL